MEKHVICLKDYRIESFLSIWHAHGDLCKHLGIYSSTDLDDRYSNLFLNAYIRAYMPQHQYSASYVYIITVYISLYNILKDKISDLTTYTCDSKDRPERFLFIRLKKNGGLKQ